MTTTGTTAAEMAADILRMTREIDEALTRLVEQGRIPEVQK